MRRALIALLSAAARREGTDDIIELTPLSVGPEGRRQAW